MAGASESRANELMDVMLADVQRLVSDLWLEPST